jgi:hypothetical protein
MGVMEISWREVGINKSTPHQSQPRLSGVSQRLRWGICVGFFESLQQNNHGIYTSILLTEWARFVRAAMIYP